MTFNIKKTGGPNTGVDSIGDAGVEKVRLLGARIKGVLIPEIAEAFETSIWSARRFVNRMIKEGVLKRTDKRRQRWDIFGYHRSGNGGFVYRSVVTACAPAWLADRRRRNCRRKGRWNSAHASVWGTEGP